MDDNCVFCDIIAGKIPATIIADTHKDIIVIADRSPKAPIHYLILPKKHIADLRTAETTDGILLGQILLVARDIAATFGKGAAFRLIFNNGPEAGQTVHHMHAHFLSGTVLSE